MPNPWATGNTIVFLMKKIKLQELYRGSAWKRNSSFPSKIYTEQMHAEGLGRKLLLTPSGDARKAPEKQTVGTVISISQNANPASTFKLSEGRHRKDGAAWAEERLLGALRQSVPQNGRVHLHIIDKNIARTQGCFFSRTTPLRVIPSVRWGPHLPLGNMKIAFWVTSAQGAVFVASLKAHTFQISVH